MSLERLARQTVTVKPKTGLEGSGFAQATYGEPFTLKARVAWRSADVRTIAGAVVTSPVQVVCPGDPAIGLEDLVDAGDGYRPIVSVEKAVGRWGTVHHVRVLLT